MLSRKGKKGQVTLFVIIGIVIAAGIGTYFAVRPRLAPAPIELSPEAFIEKCMSDNAGEAISKLSPQGGSLEPELYILYNNKTVEYLCYTNLYYTACQNQRPLLKEHVEAEITSYVKPRLQACISDLKEKKEAEGWTVTTGVLTLTTTLMPKKIILEAEMPLTLRKGEQVISRNKFKTILSEPLYELVMLASEISNQEAHWGNFDQLGYMIFYRQYDIEKIRDREATIYTLRDRNSKLAFTFAVRGYVMPPGI